MKDIYLPIQGCKGYLINKDSNIMRYPYCNTYGSRRIYKLKRIEPFLNNNKYFVVELITIDNQFKRFLLSKLIINAFYKPYDYKEIKIIYKNKNKLDNRLDNLRLVIKSNNKYLKYKRDPLVYKRNIITTSKLSEDIFLSIIKDINSNINIFDLSHKYNLSLKLISSISNSFKNSPSSCMFINN